MNRTARLALVPAFILLCSGATFGQLSDAAKRAPNADTAAITRHIDAAVKSLTTDDPDKQARGREDLATGLVIAADPNAQPSPVFIDAYTTALAKALTPLANHEDMRVRLNAAIVAARVAERAGNDRLAEVAVRFMNDKNPAVALWGVKAARAMLPMALTKGGDNNPLVKGLIQIVERVMTGAAVTEVYDAVSLNVITAKPPPGPAVIKGAVPVMLRVFRLRVDGYGVVPPPDAALDNVASEFLSFGPVWQQMAAPQRTEAVQAMADLLSYAAQHAQLLEGADRTELITIFKRTGAALQVIGDANKMPAVANAAREVQRISTGMDGTEIIQRVTTLTDALKQAFPGLQDTKKIQLAPIDDAGGPPGEAPPAGEEGTGEAPAPGTTPPAGKAPAPGATGPGPGAPGTGAPGAGTPPPPGGRGAPPRPTPGTPGQEGADAPGAPPPPANGQPPAPGGPNRPPAPPR